MENSQLINSNTDSINTNSNSIATSFSKIIQVEGVVEVAMLSLSETVESHWQSLSNRISNIGETVGELTTDNIAETSSRKYVSNTAMTEMDISTDSISQGQSNKYTTIHSVKDVLAQLTSSDLPEGNLHRYVSKNNLIATGLKANELSGFSDSINEHLSSISSDNLPEGNQNIFFTAERVRNVLQDTTTDDIYEGSNNKYFSEERVRYALSTASSTNIEEGSNLYFTTERVLHTLSVATTDALPQGMSNLYLTKHNVLSMDLDVSELNDSSNSLLTTDSFLSQVSAHLTTDIIPEGNQKYVSRESISEVLSELSTDHLKEGYNLYFTSNRVNQIIDDSFDAKFDSAFQSKTTDNLTQGSNLYFTENTLIQTLNLSHIIGTGLTPEHIGARPASLSIHASEIVESTSALFFNTNRFDTHFETKTTDNLQEANNKYFTTDRVVQSLQTIGNLSVSLISNTPGELQAYITVSNDQVLGGKIELQVGDVSYHEFELTNSSVSKLITQLNPENLLVTTTLKSRYGSQTNEQAILICGEIPHIQNLSFIETEPGFSNEINMTFGGHGTCDLIISSHDFIIHNCNLNLFERSDIQIDLNCLFDSATFVLQRKGVIIDSLTKAMNHGLVLPMKHTFNIKTNLLFNALNTTPFEGISITIQNDIRTLNGNLFHSSQTPLGAILSATENVVYYGTSSGNLKSNLTSVVGFISFT